MVIKILYILLTYLIRLDQKRYVHYPISCSHMATQIQQIKSRERDQF
jgi:hypothetical protein